MTNSTVLADIVTECEAQHRQWGDQHHPAGTHHGYRLLTRLLQYLCDRAERRGRRTWRHILTEEVAEALAEPNNLAALRAELAQAAAVIVTWITDIERVDHAPAT